MCKKKNNYDWQDTPSLGRQESTTSDSSVRASKRRRVPNKFYGYSSDEDADKTPHLKRTKLEEVNRVSWFFLGKQMVSDVWMFLDNSSTFTTHASTADHY